MINIANLTQERQWGIQFVVMEANAQIEKENIQIAQINQQDPDAIPVPLKPLWTVQSYIDHTLNEICDSYYRRLIEHKKKVALDMFDALTPVQQADLVLQLGIPDILPS